MARLITVFTSKVCEFMVLIIVLHTTHPVS